MTAGAGGAATADPTPYRFRRLLALYPARWQAEHGEAYLGVMLDLAEADARTRPTARERVSLLRHLAGVWRAELARRAAADRGLATFRWLAPLALVNGVTLAVLCTVLGEWGPVVPGLQRAAPPPDAVWPDGPRLGILTTGVLLYAVWAVAAVLAVAGRSAAARRAFAVAAVLPAGLVVLEAVTGLPRPLLGVLAAFTAFAAVAAVGWPDGLPTRVRATVAVASVGTALLATAVLLARAWVFAHEGIPAWYLGPLFYSGAGLAWLAPVVGPVVAVATVAGIALLRRRPAVLAGAVLLGQPWLLLVHGGPFAIGASSGWWVLHREPAVLLALGVAYALALTASAGSAALRAARAG